MRAIAAETARLFRAAGTERRAAEVWLARTRINPPTGSRSRLLDATGKRNGAGVAARRRGVERVRQRYRRSAMEQRPRDQPNEKQAGDEDPCAACLHRKRIEELHELPFTLPATALAAALAHGLNDHLSGHSPSILLDGAPAEYARRLVQPMRADERTFLRADSQRSRDERAIGADDRLQGALLPASARIVGRPHGRLHFPSRTGFFAARRLPLVEQAGIGRTASGTRLPQDLGKRPTVA